MNYAKILKQSSFNWLFLSTLSSNLANSIANISLIWIAYNRFDSPMVIALVLAAMQLPALVIGPFMGGFLDKFKKVKLMILANIINALVFTFLLFNPLQTAYDLLLFTILLIASGAAKPLLMGGTSMIIQDLFADSTLKNAANSLITMSFDLTYIFGSLLSGLVLALGYGSKVYALVSTLYVLVALCYAQIKLPQSLDERKAGTENERYFTDLVNAFKFIQSDREVVLALLMDFIWNMLLWAGLTVLLPVIVKEVYSNSAAQYGLLEAMTSVGIVLGSLMLGLLNNPKKGLVTIVVGSIALHGLLFTLIGFSTSVYVTASLLLLIGIIVAPALVYKTTFYQTVFTTQSKGMLFTLAGTMTSASYPIGIALTTALASMLGKNSAFIFIIFGLLTFVVAAIVDVILNKGAKTT